MFEKWKENSKERAKRRKELKAALEAKLTPKDKLILLKFREPSPLWVFAVALVFGGAACLVSIANWGLSVVKAIDNIGGENTFAHAFQGQMQPMAPIATLLMIAYGAAFLIGFGLSFWSLMKWDKARGELIEQILKEE